MTTPINKKSIGLKLLQVVSIAALLFGGTALSAQERIELADGSVLTVFMVQPAQTTDAPSPLLILMGGGPGNASGKRHASLVALSLFNV